MNENLEYLTIFEDDVILGENAEVFLAQDEWLKHVLILMIFLLFV